MEVAVRYFIAPLMLIGVLGLAGPALARDIAMHKHSAEEIKSVCDTVGGSFSQGANMYGCGTDCRGGPGTDCIVHCNAGKKCTAQVIGARRPHNVAQALTKGQRR